MTVAQHPRQPDGGPLLFVLTLIVMTVGLGLGYPLGLGKVATLAALTGLFCLLATFTDALRPDLRRMAWLGPLLLLAACIPRALSHWHAVAGMIAVAVIVFLLALFPAFSPRFRIVMIGTTYVTIAGYGLALPPDAPASHIVIAVVLGIGIAVSLRVLVGLRDPGGHTRAQISEPLVSPTFDSSDVIRSWLVDRPSVWTTTTLTSALRYRRAVGLLSSFGTGAGDTAADEPVARIVAELNDRAAQVAEEVRARHPAQVEPDDEPLCLEAAGPQVRQVATTAARALTTIRHAARERDTTPAPGIAPLRSIFWRAKVRSLLSPGSDVVSQAAAKGTGILLAGLTGLQTAQPALANTYFNAVVSMLQPTWSQTFQRIAYRIAGSVIAVAIVVVAVLWLPPFTMDVLAVVGLFVLTWFLFSHQILSNAGGVMMTVSMSATLRHLDALTTLRSLIIMVVVAIAIVVLVSLPGIMRARRLTGGVVLDEALHETSDLLGRLESDPPGTDAEQFQAFLRGTEISRRLRIVAADLPDDDRRRAGRAADLIDALTLITVIYNDDARHDRDAYRATLAAARNRLDHPAAPGRTVPGDAGVLLCARELARTRTA